MRVKEKIIVVEEESVEFEKDMEVTVAVVVDEVMVVKEEVLEVIKEDVRVKVEEEVFRV